MTDLETALNKLKSQGGEFHAITRDTQPMKEIHSTVADFIQRVADLGIPAIPLGYYKDCGATGIIGQRRLGAFEKQEDGWVIRSRQGTGAFITMEGTIMRGRTLSIVPAGSKMSPDKFVSFMFAPKGGFGFVSNPDQRHVFASHHWQFREDRDVHLYVEDMARFLLSHRASR